MHIHVLVCVCLRAAVCVCLCVRACAHAQARGHTLAFVCWHIQTRMLAYACVCIYLYACVCMRIICMCGLCVHVCPVCARVLVAGATGAPTGWGSGGGQGWQGEARKPFPHCSVTLYFFGNLGNPILGNSILGNPILGNSILATPWHLGNPKAKEEIYSARPRSLLNTKI